ncbi:YcgL domain-containing protein [Teredinibacter waterburyi]|jgi:Uncharacterized protein conserved in bacteria|uniref:YcgL domain-containing protein n=1 Tax=Teredinibacter waterburyi TaxID=1500538 RepID=UPI003182C56D
MKLLVDIYRSKNKEGMYLYVRKGFDLDLLPEPLRKQFGKAEQAMSLMLTPERKLARVSVEKVIAQIEAEDFYLQMPPQINEAYMQQIPNDLM